jgi:transcription initiation factor TFIID subunit 6
VDSRTLELLPKGPNVNPNLQALNGYDNVTVKPLVKHILSKELNLFFDKVCAAVVDESNEEFRIAAFASLKEDPGLHQLVPYFVQYVAEKVTHNLDNMFILTQMMNLTESMILNESFHVDPYVRTL